MRRPSLVVLTLALATMLHVDWHLARPAHHRLSLGWPLHWVVTGLAFATAGWWIGRQQTSVRWRAAAVVFLAATVLAQGVEPVLEVLLYDGRLGYPDDPGRWAAFGQAMTAAIPAYFGSVWLSSRQPSALRAS